VISRTEFVAKVQRLGPRRAALTTCLTCFETAQRWPTWEVDPCRRIAREVRSADWKQDTQLRDELTAMAELISRHRPEFDSILASLGETVRLADHRRKVRRTGA
jgi:pterin-4a-carbinolamine dehydratase